jgi:hypothetical protein
MACWTIALKRTLGIGFLTVIDFRGGVRFSLSLLLCRAAKQGGNEQQVGTKALVFLRGPINTPGLGKAVRPERGVRVMSM